jgi:nitrous oxidase accessory protein NosD
MSCSSGSRRRVWRVASITGLVLVAVLAGLGGSIARAVTTCAVTDSTQATSFSDLQSAINAATAGDTLNVRGRCAGNFVIDRNLTLKGRPKPHHDTLDGNNSGIVVTVNSGVTAMITNLVITHGNNSSFGGGIQNSGRLTLNGSARVNYNSGGQGGGIENFGSLSMTGAAQVEHNTAAFSAGIDSYGPVTLTGHAHVNNNTATNSAGGIWICCAGDSSTLTLGDHAQVNGNTAASTGGGIVAGGDQDLGVGSIQPGAVILKGSAEVINNIVTNSGGAGGGIRVLGLGTVTACQTWTGKISPNTPDDPPTPTIDTTC